ncbi:hypothetical protein BV898_06247 [Hypsibius exemplaris]|uniref:RING-type domain-containing protein n=1 Tax=Hypsibius exemplaris TaxID=2072580 RepID=A0A1W0WX15_HYPEX|nr:hypothetical protein BV898_06247 [Hypsibius exemplaris]
MSQEDLYLLDISEISELDISARAPRGSNALEEVPVVAAEASASPQVDLATTGQIPTQRDVRRSSSLSSEDDTDVLQLSLPSTDQLPVCPTPPTATLTVVPANLILQIGTEKHETQIQIARNLPGITAVTELNFFVTALNTDGLSSEDYDQRPAYLTPPTATSVVVQTNLIPQIGTEKHETHLQTARNLPGINAVTGHTQYYRQKTYLVTGLNETAVKDAVRTIELRVVSVTVRFPGNFFQDAPEDRQLMLKLHVESSNVVLTFSGDTQSTDVLISVEGVDSNVEQATEMLLRIKTDFNYAEDMRMARRDTAARKHQGSNAWEGVTVVPAKPPQETVADCIICVDIPSNTAFIPCGHKTFCESCAEQILQGNGECPTCRGPITSVLRLYG